MSIPAQALWLICPDHRGYINRSECFGNLVSSRDDYEAMFTVLHNAQMEINYSMDLIPICGGRWNVYLDALLGYIYGTGYTQDFLDPNNVFNPGNVRTLENYRRLAQYDDEFFGAKDWLGISEDEFTDEVQEQILREIYSNPVILQKLKDFHHVVFLTMCLQEEGFDDSILVTRG